MTLLDTLAPPPTQEAAETPAVGGHSDEPTGRTRLVARWTADARPTATWSVERPAALDHRAGRPGV